MKNIALRFISTTLFLAGVLQAQTTCQNQICKFASTCFGCTLNEGFKCSVDIDDCKKCTSARCQEPYHPLMTGSRAGRQNGSRGDIEGVATAIAKSKDRETVVSLFRNSGAPLELVTATHGPDDLLAEASLRNLTTDKVVTKYRIGYFTVARDLSVEATTGVDMNVPGKIKPGQSERVPAQGVSSRLLTKVRGVAFFVASVEFDDGSTWTADVSSMKSKLETLVTRRQ